MNLEIGPEEGIPVQRWRLAMCAAWLVVACAGCASASLPELAAPTAAVGAPADTPVRVTPTELPLATPQPSATPTATPYVVAVEADLYAAHQGLWSEVERSVENLRMMPDDGRLVSAKLVWTWQAAPDDTLVGSEPYLWVCHHAADVTDLTWASLADLAGKGWTLLAPAECGGLLADQMPGATAEMTLAEDAAHRAARDRRTLALVPWAEVGAEVRALAFAAERFHTRDASEWPIRRALVLRGSPPPDGLIDALAEIAPIAPEAIELVGVGDVMLARNVGDKIASEGVRYPYEGPGIAELLQGADVTFGNLECAVSTEGVRQSKAYTFRADPKALEGLAWAGFDIVSLANNHTCDYGRDAVIDTVRNVKESGIAAVGAGENLDRAREAQLVEAGDLTLAFLAYNQIGPRWMDAASDRAGSAYMDVEAMMEDVQRASERADLVIVSCHWGVEHAAYTTAYQRDLGARLWAAGADLILGHHPHVMEAIAVEGRQATVYSMGNFIFDMGTPGSRDGYAVRCWLDATGVRQIELVPYRIDGYRPSLLEGADRVRAVSRIHALATQAGGWPK